MKHLRPFNESTDDSINQILNIARDEGLIVTDIPNGDQRQLEVRRCDDYSFNGLQIILMEEREFFELISEIHNRVKSIASNVEVWIHVKYYGPRPIDEPSLRVPERDVLGGKEIVGYFINYTL